jgi:hypothetical protein
MEEQTLKAGQKSRALRFGVAAAVGLAALTIYALQPALSSTATDQKVIASSTSNGFRVLVTADKGGDSEAPTATVKIAAFERNDGEWVQLGSALRIGAREGWFWYVVTGPHSVRDFCVNTDVPESISIRLLVTPSIGWSDLYRFHVEGGALVRG